MLNDVALSSASVWQEFWDADECEYGYAEGAVCVYELGGSSGGADTEGLGKSYGSAGYDVDCLVSDLVEVNDEAWGEQWSDSEESFAAEDASDDDAYAARSAWRAWDYGAESVTEAGDS